VSTAARTMLDARRRRPLEGLVAKRDGQPLLADGVADVDEVKIVQSGRSLDSADDGRVDGLENSIGTMRSATTTATAS